MINRTSSEAASLVRWVRSPKLFFHFSLRPLAGDTDASNDAVVLFLYFFRFLSTNAQKLGFLMNPQFQSMFSFMLRQAEEAGLRENFLDIYFIR